MDFLVAYAVALSVWLAVMYSFMRWDTAKQDRDFTDLT